MKITTEHFAKIETALDATLDQAGLTRCKIDNMRLAWDVLWAANQTGRLSLDVLYPQYDDNHIETALRRIFPMAHMDEHVRNGGTTD